MYICITCVYIYIYRERERLKPSKLACAMRPDVQGCDGVLLYSMMSYDTAWHSRGHDLGTTPYHTMPSNATCRDDVLCSVM